MIPQPDRDQTAVSIVLDQTSSPLRIIFKQGAGSVGELNIGGTSSVSWEFLMGEQTPDDLPYRSDLLLYSYGIPEGSYCRECEEVIGYTHEDATRDHYDDHEEGYTTLSDYHVPIDPYSDANDLDPLTDIERGVHNA